MMFASDFSGLASVLVGVPAAAIVFGLMSLYPSHRGHWSCLLLAIPCLLVGVFLSLALFEDGLGFFLVLALAPLILGVASIWLWVARVIESDVAKEKSRSLLG